MKKRNHGTRNKAKFIAVAAGAITIPLLSIAPTATPAASAPAVKCAKNVKAFSGYVAAGASALAGANVVLYADPDLSRLGVGQSANLRKLGTARTDASGCFQVASKPGWMSAAGPGGVTDVRVFISRPGRTEMRLVPVTMTRGASGVTQVTSASPGAGAAASVMHRFTGAETVHDGYSASSGTAGSPGFSRATGARTPASVFVAERRGQSGTRWVKRADYGKRPVLIGQWWSTTQGVEQKWRYKKGSSSALEAAFTLAGEHGEYKHSETISSATNASIGFPVVRGKAGKYFRSYFSYGKYDLESYDYIDGWTYIGTWVRRTTWERGTQVSNRVPVPNTPAANCSPYRAGSDDTTSVSRAITWNDGVNLSASMKGVLGSVSLSSRTGFTNEATNYVEFTRNARLCGVYGKLSQPGALVARRSGAG